MSALPSIDHSQPAADSATQRDRSREARQRAVRDCFAFMKKTNALDDLLAKSIPLRDGEGYLVAVCDLHLDDRELIEKLARWRSENSDAFPTRFPVTLEGTASWLRSRLLDVEDRILFLVLDRFGSAIGHLGFANAINPGCQLEVDNVVRGVSGARPGIMGRALKALLDWATEMLMPSEIYLRVFSDNAHAIEFYRKLGFVAGARIPLIARRGDSSVSFSERLPSDTTEPDAHFLRMVYQPQPEPVGATLISTAGPSISAREASYALDAARYGWNSRHSGYIQAFERRFAEHVGVRYAISTSSCTGALHIALAALGIGPGDEVIVPDLTWVATGNAVLYTGATPVFADVQRDSWCLDPDSLQASITERTRAVIPVHLYGHPAAMDRIMAIARERGLHVIEDAAAAAGAELGGRGVGTFGDFAAYSFQGAKLLVAGEGGMLVTNDESLYRRAHSCWDQGRKPGTFWIAERGLKYKMSNVQAAIGLGQLERVELLVEAKRRIFDWYAEALEGVPFIELNHETSWARSTYWMTSVVLHELAPLSRDELIAELRARNVDSRPVFPAISQYPIWPRPQTPGPVSRSLGRQGINLPSGVRLRRDEVCYVAAALREALLKRS